MCNCLTIQYSTVTESETLNLVNSTFIGGRPSYKFVIEGIEFVLKYDNVNNRWVLYNDTDAQVEYVWVSQALCPYSILSNWTQQPLAAIDLTSLSIAEYSGVCDAECGQEYVMTYKGDAFSGALTAHSSVNGRSSFLFEFTAASNTISCLISWDGVDAWKVLYLQSAIVVAELAQDTLAPIGIFTMIEDPETWQGLRTTSLPCPVYDLCDCGITLEIDDNGTVSNLEMSVAGTIS